MMPKKQWAHSKSAVVSNIPVSFSSGYTVYDPRSRELGVPVQGIKTILSRDLGYFSVSMGISTLRVWVFVGWHWRWKKQSI